MACDIFNAVGVEGLLAFSAILFEINLQHTLTTGNASSSSFFIGPLNLKLSPYHLVGALNTPDVGALPPQVTLFAVIISILLFQELLESKYVLVEQWEMHGLKQPLPPPSSTHLEAHRCFDL